MGVSMYTALEIITNPLDLEVVITGGGNKWGFIIARGNGRSLITADQTCAKSEDAIRAVINLLHGLSQQVEEDFDRLVEVPEGSELLNKDFQQWIAVELRDRGVARTRQITSLEYQVYRGFRLPVFLVVRQKKFPFFGQAFGKVDRVPCYAEVREDLPGIVQRFVKLHELHHLVDQCNWLGAYGREFRANFFPGIRDPVGLVACVLATVFSKARFKLYVHRLWHGY